MTAWPWWALLVGWAVVVHAIEPADPPPAPPPSLAQLCVAPAPSPAPELDALLLARIAAARRAAGAVPLQRSAAADARAQYAVCKGRILAQLWQPSEAAYRALLADPAQLRDGLDWRVCTVGVWHYQHPSGRVIGAAVYGKCPGVPL